VTDPDLRRYHLLIQYDGIPFRGWQRQGEAAGPTVQGEVEAVIERLTEARRPVIAAGRTDTGVHASGQVASVDIPSKWDAAALRKSMNALLPRAIRIPEVRRVPGDFHPRYHATARRYHYYLGTAEGAASPFRNRWCWVHLENDVSGELLQEAAALIPGDHSFDAFAKAGQSERGHRCRVEKARWEPWEDLGFRFRITSNRYLHHMVRYLVGTMVAVARSRRPLDDMVELLRNPETRLTTSPPAPPAGLFLSRVEYPRERLGDHPDRDPPPSLNEDDPHA
jgi:tRNA pseudouridine38-40 synthase